jgi:hypothetical protein
MPESQCGYHAVEAGSPATADDSARSGMTMWPSNM